MSTTPNALLEEWPSGTPSGSVPVNDALQVIDALLRPGGIVQDKDLTAPPTTVFADAGKRWIVGPSATGAWAGKDGQIALCTAADTWRYFTPSEGWRAYLLDEDAEYTHNGTAWELASPPFGTIPQNSQSGAYTLVMSDKGKHILHPSADTTSRTWTIPANGTVAFPIGTAVTFVNQSGAGAITIAITTDTMRLAGAGTTGNRTLAANGIATAVKITSTEWIISGTGLT